MHVHLLSMTIRRVDGAVHTFVHGFIFQIADGFCDGGALPASITKTCACTAAGAQGGTGAWSSSTGGAGCVAGEAAAWAQECWATTTAEV
jgi:hypothetical protein